MKRSSVLLVTAALVGAGLSAIPTPIAHAAYPGGNGRILYINGDLGSTKIFSAKADGSDVDTLTPTAAAHGEPESSPNAQKIAFEKGTEIWVMDSDGENAARVSPMAVTRRDPSWKPDMTELSWTDGGTLYRYNLDTQVETPLLAQGSAGTDCAGERLVKYLQAEWSPLGDKLVALRETDAPATGGCTRPPDPIRDLVLVTPQGAVTELTNDATLDAFPDWHPDGSKIVFNRGTQATGFFGVSTIPASGGSPTKLTQDDTGTQPVYSPSGNKVLYVRDANNDSKFDLWTMNSDGTGQASLIQDANSNRFPDWTVGKSVIVVNRETDEEDANTSNDRCDTNTNTSGNQCTLRAAIQEANARAGADEIRFKIPASRQKRVAVQAPLPPITGEVKIDGLSQNDDGKPGIQVTGSLLTSNDPALKVDAPDVVIQGLIFTKFKDAAAIQLNGGDAEVKKNWFGIKPVSGEYQSQPNQIGVEVKSAGNTIGGPSNEDKNHFASSGNLNKMLDLSSLVEDRNSATPVQLTQAMKAIGAGIIVAEGASNTTIEGNDFGRAPDGNRVGRATEFGNIPFGNMIAIMVAPTGGSASNTTIGGTTASRRNVISGNGLGIVALAYGGATIAGLDVQANMIGPKRPDTPSSFFGNAVGMMAAGSVTGLEVGGAGPRANAIQGNMTGLMLGELSGATIENNDIGVDRKLFDLTDHLAQERPSIGLHNFFGVILGNTQNVTMGGATGLGNRVHGNLVSVLMGGSNSQGNSIVGNSIGLTNPSSRELSAIRVGDLGTLIGVLSGEGTQNSIGAPGQGNTFSGNLFGALSVKTAQEKVQGNTFNKNFAGYFSALPAGTTVGGTAENEGNHFRNGLFGMIMAHREMTMDERRVSDADDAPAGKSTRKEPFRAENTDLALDVVAPVAGDTDLSANAAVVNEPPAPGTNNKIQGNHFGTTAGGAARPNFVGAWLLGDLTSTTFGTGGDSETAGANVVAHNKAGGVWVGPQITAQSKIDLRGNSIYDNSTDRLTGVAPMGIDLLPPASIDAGNPVVSFGVSPNDNGDGDSGGNGRQNYPVITDASAVGDNLTLTGTLSSANSTTYSIELYASEVCGKAGVSQGQSVTRYGEGQTLIKRYDVMTSGSGTVAIDNTATLPAGQRKVTATATGPDGTSEFSRCVSVP